MPLNGKPVLAWSAGLLQHNEYIDFAVMVVNSDYIALWNDISDRYGLAKFVSTVPGGVSRQSSVYGGLKRCLEIAGHSGAIVAVHDGARPLATQEMLRSAIESAEKYGGAVVSVPVSDTVKQVTDGFIVNTPERASLYMAQTPQAFRFALLTEAYESAEKDGFTGSDDAVLVERIGGRVHIVAGSNRNIKITYADDLTIAELYIKGGNLSE
jgi:2-C-methyl-D-erythritol 4-phosphate cytidylyltransferase